jgi:hypothetical protein
MDLTITGKTRVTPATAAVLYDGITKVPDRYKWLSLDMAEPNLGIPLSGVDLGSLVTGSYQFSSTQTFLLCSNVKGERGWVAFNAAEQQFDSEERPDLTNVDMSLEWLLYRDPFILNFQLSAAVFGPIFRPGIVGGLTPSIPILLEAGTAPGAGTGVVTLSWITNKVDERAIKKYYLKAPNGEINETISKTITGGYDFKTYTLPFIDTSVIGTSTFALTAEDWKKVRATGVVVVSALGPIFYGTTSSTAFTILSSTIKNGIKTTTGSPAVTYAFNNPGGNKLFMAWPTSVNYTPNRFLIAPATNFVLINPSLNINNNIKVLLDSGAEVTYTVFVTENGYNSSPTLLTLI